MAALQEQRDLFELDCPDCQVRSASFVPDDQGGVFSCSIDALSEAALKELDTAARRHEPIRLLFARQPIELELVTLERKDPQLVRIIGRVRRAEASR